MISERPGFDARAPYIAVKWLLYEAHAGRLDSDVLRAFLDCMSLFPVGSQVRLSTGSVARVLRANGSLHTRPVVLPLDSDGVESDVELDLAATDTVQVASALAGPREPAQPGRAG